MQGDSNSPRDADTSHAIEIAHRVWWVGQQVGEPERLCHSYLIEQGDQSVLLDPGSPLTFAGTLRKIREVIPFDAIRWIVCHQQDADSTAALPRVDQLVSRPDATVLSHRHICAALRHYDLRLAIEAVETYDWHLHLLERELRFLSNPCADAAGPICSFDTHAQVLFSGHLYRGVGQPARLIAQQVSDLQTLRPLQAPPAPGLNIRELTLSHLRALQPRLISPKQGYLIPDHLVATVIERANDPPTDIDLSDVDDEIGQLARLHDTLRAITETMLMSRDFAEIANRLLTLLQPTLHVERIEYHAAMPDKRILTLDPDTNYIGITEGPPPDVCGFIGRTRARWVAEHRLDPRLRTHRLQEQRFCVQSAPDGGSLVTLPLTARGLEQIEALAVMRLPRGLQLTEMAKQLMVRIADPLQVALEREVLYRSVDLQREQAYQRSIRDPLTGLFTRFYMHDVLRRQCAIHDRDRNAVLCALMLDVDHFKAVNDSHGHGAGDRVLGEIATLIQASCRGTDVAVRYGGEEILIVVIGQAIPGAAMLAHRLRDAIAARAFDIGTGRPLHVTVSIGVAEHGQGEAAAQFIHRADASMYQAKHAGRNRVAVEAGPTAS